MTKKVEERFGNMIIRKFFGLGERPEVSKETEALHKMMTSDDKTRKGPEGKEEPLDKPMK